MSADFCLVVIFRGANLTWKLLENCRKLTVEGLPFLEKLLPKFQSYLS